MTDEPIHVQQADGTYAPVGGNLCEHQIPASECRIVGCRGAASATDELRAAKARSRLIAAVVGSDDPPKWLTDALDEYAAALTKTPDPATERAKAAIARLRDDPELVALLAAEEPAECRGESVEGTMVHSAHVHATLPRESCFVRNCELPQHRAAEEPAEGLCGWAINAFPDPYMGGALEADGYCVLPARHDGEHRLARPTPAREGLDVERLAKELHKRFCVGMKHDFSPGDISATERALAALSSEEPTNDR